MRPSEGGEEGGDGDGVRSVVQSPVPLADTRVQPGSTWWLAFPFQTLGDRLSAGPVIQLNSLLQGPEAWAALPQGTPGAHWAGRSTSPQPGS